MRVPVWLRFGIVSGVSVGLIYIFQSALAGVFILLLGFFELACRIWKTERTLARSETEGRWAGGTKSLFMDETTDILSHYKAIVDRNENLMVQVAEKVVVEKEVQTAEIVQALFFPDTKFVNPSLNLFGKVMTATQCGGDWWNYRQVGDYLVVGVGDATGHGMSAALIMAAMHGAYSISMELCEKEKDKMPSLKEILSNINQSSHSVSGGEDMVTFVNSVIHLKKGILSITNASHPTPYLLRKQGAKPNGRNDADIRDVFIPLIVPLTKPLGVHSQLEVESRDIQLEPGDVIFWYTDGFLNFSKSRKDGTPDRLSILRLLAETVTSHFPDAEMICERLVALCSENRNRAPAAMADDITMIVGVVPETAVFER